MLMTIDRGYLSALFRPVLRVLSR